MPLAFDMLVPVGGAVNLQIALIAFVFFPVLKFYLDFSLLELVLVMLILLICRFGSILHDLVDYCNCSLSNFCLKSLRQLLLVEGFLDLFETLVFPLTLRVLPLLVRQI
jgi:hypothetical protein